MMRRTKRGYGARHPVPNAAGDRAPGASGVRSGVVALALVAIVGTATASGEPASGSDAQPPAANAPPIGSGAASTREPRVVASAADAAAFREIERKWLEYYRAADVDGLLTLYSADAWVMPRGKPARRGHAEIREYFAGIMGRADVALESRLEDLEVRGDLAYLVGLFRIAGRARDGGAEFTDSGRFLIIYRREADGRWRVWRDIDTRTPDADRLPAPALR